MKSERNGINPAAKPSGQVASNAWLWADGGCIFADAPNAVTSAAVTAAYAIGIGAAYWLVERTTAFFITTIVMRSPPA